MEDSGSDFKYNNDEISINTVYVITADTSCPPVTTASLFADASINCEVVITEAGITPTSSGVADDEDDDDEEDDDDDDDDVIPSSETGGAPVKMKNFKAKWAPEEVKYKTSYCICTLLLFLLFID